MSGPGGFLAVLPSPRSVDAVAAALPAAAARHGFGVLGGYDFRAKLAEKGVRLDREARVFDLCHPAEAGRVLAADGRIAALLPCRVAVYEEGGATRVAALRPAVMPDALGMPSLAPVAERVGPALEAIMREAAGGGA